MSSVPPFYCTTSQLKPSPVAGRWFYDPTPKLAVIAPLISSKDGSSWAEVLRVGIRKVYNPVETSLLTRFKSEGMSGVGQCSFPPSLLSSLPPPPLPPSLPSSFPVSLLLSLYVCVHVSRCACASMYVHMQTHCVSTSKHTGIVSGLHVCTYTCVYPVCVCALCGHHLRQEHL